ncbi:hypothetical protein SAMN05192566_2036 [Methylophilus rhizosphaerae]|uniref:Sulphur transport domain-containing protein n=1 Tax=Methylophilus rhizosphaerae TaxID=492660 RepID=A0A1G9DWZ5_9PROT|nr:DUF6691 family protein [Methylophilus rhizosphaerae]SDK68378.1 hypothetical protein SAMN05192566_2036 [Methylophilus rhizosphaerae]
MANLIALLAGVIFGLGLIVGGMTNPAKVLAFLDITGDWDPSLAFVMMGAIAIGFFAFRAAARQSSSLLGLPVQLPATTLIDRKLVAGAVIFGAGWGLAGFCPGPAVASVLTGGSAVGIFVASMLAGMGLHTLAVRRGWI